MNREWLNDLRRKMEDHTEDVPEGLWDDLRSELFEEDRHSIGTAPTDLKGQAKSHTNPGFTPLVYRIGSVAAVVAFIFFGINHFFQVLEEKAAVQKNTLSEHSKIKKTTPASYGEIENNPISFSHQDQFFKNNKVSNLIKEKQTGNISSETIKEIFKRAISPISNSQDEHQSSDFNLQNPAFSEEKMVKSNVDNFRERDELLGMNDFVKKTDLTKTKPDQSWTVSLLTGNASPGSAGEVPGYATFDGSNMSISDVFHSSGTEVDPLTQVLLANQNQEVEAKIKHKMPVTFGASVYYKIGKRWGIGTGITYTRLSSELHSGSDSNYILSDQAIHYVGIPVQLNYTVLKISGFTGYLTGGTLIEKSVSGNLKTKYVVENAVKNETDEKLSANPMQISVNAAAGVQVNITEKFGIYAEPGLGYHFKDNSSLNTIYKEKPLNFNLRFGIRLSLD